MTWKTCKRNVLKTVSPYHTKHLLLIPKVKDLLTLNDFRPISLIGCLYKIIAKALVSRIKKIIGLLVEEVQSGFIVGRNILDEPLIVNEIVSWVKKCKEQAFLFKIDFDKAFDSHNWNSLYSLMLKIGFGNRWRLCIRGCHASARDFVLINRSPFQEFFITKGVRHGDPLSPFLFIIVMEDLNVLMNSTVQHSIFQGLQIPYNGLSISHIFYTDKAIFLCERTRSNIVNMSRILKCFQAISGLNVNFQKSKVYSISVCYIEINNCARILGCTVASFLFVYLGVMVGANMTRKKSQKIVIEKVQGRLSN